MSSELAMLCVILFFVGMIEDFISAWHTKTIAKGQALISGINGFIYVAIVYLVLRIVFENLQNFWVIIAYALGSGVGSMILVNVYRRASRKDEASLVEGKITNTCDSSITK